MRVCPVTPPRRYKPGDGPCCDGGGELAGSNDGLPETRSSGDGYWRGRGCSGGQSQGDQGTDVPCGPPTAPTAIETRQDGQLGDGSYCDDSERLAGSNDGLPQARSSGDGYRRGRGCSGGRNPVHNGHVGCLGYARGGKDHGEEPREFDGTRQGYMKSLGADHGVVDWKKPLKTCCGIQGGAIFDGMRSDGAVERRATTGVPTSGSSSGGGGGGAFKQRLSTPPGAPIRRLWGPFFYLWRMLGTLLALCWRFRSRTSGRRPCTPRKRSPSRIWPKGWAPNLPPAHGRHSRPEMVRTTSPPVPTPQSLPRSRQVHPSS